MRQSTAGLGSLLSVLIRQRAAAVRIAGGEQEADDSGTDPGLSCLMALWSRSLVATASQARSLARLVREHTPGLLRPLLLHGSAPVERFHSLGAGSVGRDGCSKPEPR
jgi:hypothetical protein